MFLAIIISLVVGLIIGTLFGWNNGKASLIKKLPAPLQEAVNNALKS